MDRHSSVLSTVFGHWSLSSIIGAAAKHPGKQNPKPQNQNSKDFFFQMTSHFAFHCAPLQAHTETRGLETQTYTPSTCSDFVTCVDGFSVNSNGESGPPCSTACGGLCCQGERACEGFTGKVCKDGSCSGKQACRAATIPQVINSCKPWPNSGGHGSTQVANLVCDLVANDGGSSFGSVGNLTDSCWGNGACRQMAHYGEVGNVINSCHNVGNNHWEHSVCTLLAKHGIARNIISSCHGHLSCFAVAYGKPRGLGVGDITNSCGSWEQGFMLNSQGDPLAGASNCYEMARGNVPESADRELISQVTNCCRSGVDSCRRAMSDDSLIAKDPACEAAILASAITVSTFLF